RIMQLERQLQLHSQLDSVGMVDYALWSAGAYVITALTSATYAAQPSWGWWPLSSARPALQWKPPELALSPEVHLGYCWAMLSSSGTLGVALPRTIIPRAVTIDHVAKPLLFQVESAPRDVEVWIIPEHLDNTSMGAQRDAIITASGADLLDHPGLFQPHRFRATTFVRLINFTYDVHGSNAVQSFAVPGEVNEFNLKTNTVLFKFLTNWGNKEYTCLYRVRVHGDNTQE
ncbi:hypothetical protein L227DRAFT_514718, partial [Lentinus tigrinus ALCF2SS1-6]